LDELKEARAAQEAGDADYDKAAAEKERLEEAEEKEFIPLKVGSVTGARAKKQAASLLALAKSADFDTSLLEGLQGALTAKPAQRTAMDEMVIMAFETQVTTRIAELETAMAQLSPAREARAAAVQAKNDAHLVARERHVARQEALRKAVEAAKDSEAALAGRRRAVESVDSEFQELRARRAIMKDVLDDFVAGPAAALRELDPGPPTAEPPPPLGAEAAPAEAEGEIAALLEEEAAAGPGEGATEDTVEDAVEDAAGPAEDAAGPAEDAEAEVGSAPAAADVPGSDGAAPKDTEASVLRIMGMVEDMEDAEAEEAGGAPALAARAPRQEFSCKVCLKSTNEVALLLCDGMDGDCNAAYHYYCVGLDSVPEGDWFCPQCAGEEAKCFEALEPA